MRLHCVRSLVLDACLEGYKALLHPPKAGLGHMSPVVTPALAQRILVVTLAPASAEHPPTAAPALSPARPHMPAAKPHAAHAPRVAPLPALSLGAGRLHGAVPAVPMPDPASPY